MKRVKFLHCADLHLDAPFSSVGQERGRSSARRRDLKNAFEKIIRTAREEQADLLFICGDLFEHNYVRKSTINFINDGFSEIPGTEIFIVPGNHDPYSADSYYRNFSWCENVHILHRGCPFAVLEEKGVCVYGAVSGGFGEDRRMIESLKYGRQGYAGRPGFINSPDFINRSGFINVLLAHATVDMNFNGSSYYPVTSRELEMLGMDYIGLGHFHNRIEAIGSAGDIYNPGRPEPLGFDETGDHGFFLGEIIKTGGDESRVEVSFIKANSKFYKDVALDISGCRTDEQAAAKIREILAAEDARNGIYRIVLKGYPDREYCLNEGQILSYLGDEAFFIKLKDDTAIGVDIGEIACEPGLKGLFARKMLSLLKGTDDEDRKRLLLKAFRYGLEALEKGCVDVEY